MRVSNQVNADNIILQSGTAPTTGTGQTAIFRDVADGQLKQRGESNGAVSGLGGSSSGGGGYPFTQNAYCVGDRTSIITVTASSSINAVILGGTSLSNLVDGAYASGTADCLGFSASIANLNQWFQFDLAVAQRFTGFKLIGDRVFDSGIWVWQASNDGTTWQIVSSQFEWKRVLPPDGISGLTESHDIATAGILYPTQAFTRYRLIGISSNLSADPYYREVEFFVAG